MIDDIKELLSLGTRIRDAAKGADAVKTKMRTRLADYDGVLQVLLQSDFADIKNELLRLRGLYEEIDALHVKHTADPADPKWAKAAKKVNRGTQHKSIEEDLDAIDKEARQLFGIIATKSSIDTRKTIKQILELQRGPNTVGTPVAIAGGVFAALLVAFAAVILSHRNEISHIDMGEVVGLVLQDLQLEGVRITFASHVSIVAVFGALLVVSSAVIWAQRKAFSTMIRDVLPPTLPQRAAVPTGALALPRSYVERPGVQEAMGDLMDPEKALAPYMIVGMGGGGKTVLASALVRKSSVLEHFRGGIFWMEMGRGANKSLLHRLQGLAREMGAAPTDAPHGVPHVFDSLEQVMQHLAAVVSRGSSPRLVVLDDVWEREVVAAFLGVGLKVLVTTRDRSIVGVPGGLLELGDMAEDEALELLWKTSGTVGQPGDGVRTQMTKVVDRCGRLPLVLAIAGSMPVVKGKGLKDGAWEELIEEFENVTTIMWEPGEESRNLDMVLGASFNALAARKREEFLRMAVLAPGAVAPFEMLRNLWEIQDVEGTKEEAEGLVNKCLLQDVDGVGYRVHDLLLKYLRVKIKQDGERVKKATALQAQYLGRLDVVMSYGDQKHGADNQGLFGLGTLWRCLEKLSGDPVLETASYRAILGELDSCEATAEVANCLEWVALLYDIQGKFAEAEPLYERSQTILEKVLGSEHSDVAKALNNRGKYSEAEPLYERCQAIQEKILGPEHLEHPSLATTLNNRAGLLEAQGKYDDAEPLYVRAIAIGEKALGPEHPDVAVWLNNRAELLRAQGKYEEAEPLYERSQAIRETVLGPEHPDVAQSLNNRAELLRAQGKYFQAEPLYERSLAIREKALGPDHPAVAQSLIHRASLLESQGNYQEAEPLMKQSLTIRRKTLGPDHPLVAEVLNNWAGLLTKQGKYDEAEPLYASMYARMAVFEKNLGYEHPYVATAFNNWAGVLKKQGKYSEAEPLYARAVAIAEKALSPDHPDLAFFLYNWAELLKAQGKYAEAQALYVKSHATREKALGPDHRFVADSLNGLAELLRLQGKFDEAEPLCVKAIAIGEKALGPDHPVLAEYLDNRAELLRMQGNHAEAEPLCERSLAIRETMLGPEHPDVAQSLNNRAVLLESQGKHKEAISLFERSLSIRTKKLGADHPYTVGTRNWLESVRKKV
ncbi:NB-ARC and TPR repeat-containig protein [Ectocarpus siliculosus]|uniref:NB-ARC and TPR repeat-containig protein n=1 Tax=Ectocarpus siliculosus TaxID=2880 RepID=D8LPV9_ECTSI|nr:NB-ARC and TPR repeat-containig protein [Ectocarpus siliculosus]|eukprot:CBN74851.1 NB-ARC and TPR repeat-containig protein [Ectocarpus siliculosus]